MNKILFCLLFNVLTFGAYAEDIKLKTTSGSSRKKVLKVSIHGPISKAQYFIVKRGLKFAIQNNYNSVILDIDTPGGELQTTLDIINLLQNFDKPVLSYINREALSAGAFIVMATDEIYFHPDGIIGAAAGIDAQGKDLGKTLKLKINSYLKARMRNLTEHHVYRAELMSAMMDEDYELEIEGKVLKNKGELLSLTAKEAFEKYGDKKLPLLANGIFSDDKALCKKLYNDSYEIEKMSLTGFEELAQWVQVSAPIWIAIGMFLLFIEFQIPGFGIFGIMGAIMLSVVFISRYLAGLSGYEWSIVFFIGIALSIIDIFWLSTIFLWILGGALAIAGLVLSGIDIWPKKIFTIDLALPSIQDVLLSIVILAVLCFIFFKFRKKIPFLQNLIIRKSIKESSASAMPKDIKKVRAKVFTPLKPSGSVILNGEILPAQIQSGYAEAGEEVEIVSKKDFNLIVKKI